MSLINEALKKAQKDRGRNPASNVHSMGREAPPTAPPAKGIRPDMLVGALLAFALLTGLFAGLTILFLKQEAKPDTAAQSTSETLIEPATATASSRKASEVPTATVLSPDQPKVADGTEKLAGSEVANRSPEVIKPLLQPHQAATSKKLDVAALNDQVADDAAKSSLETNSGIIQWLEQSVITGIRLSESGNRVLLNGRSFRGGEYVHYAYKLKILTIQENRVIFADENGNKYLKRF